jgi:hypothetical protein
MLSNLNAQFYGYLPEYRETDPKDPGKWGDWIPIKCRQFDDGKGGIPFPSLNGGFLKQAFLFGESQAWAIAWLFAAYRDSITGKDVEVRIVPYEVNASMKISPKNSSDAAGEGQSL